ncbi:DUF4232 domain-containing protein [Streptomyces sp. NPDC005485]|uniref:DUF4232 domain-containing protein n=1 Tax=Streptomyces sp. NPDC005485 TaxID=3155591 RepID=UPI0033A697BF
MAIFRPGASATTHHDPGRAHGTALVACAAAVLGLLCGCGTEEGSGGQAQKLPGTGEPATAAQPPTTSARTPSSAAPLTGSSLTSSRAGSSQPPGASAASTHSSAGTRCHTSELRASVGRNNPGAGQENFPLVLTNRSQRTCTVHGYPGAAFVDASGKQLGPDPERSPQTPTTLTLAPGRSASAGLTFSNPQISGARTATPAALLVTPPDERDSLRVPWTQGEVPVSGNSSSVFLTVVRSGTGA